MAVLFLLVGCGSQGPDLSANNGATPPAQQSPSVAADQLPGLKEAAGIEDCPASDPDTPAVSGGLPDLLLPCLGGGRSVRLAGLQGQPVVINVWGQWCPPCREETPYLTEVSRQAKGKVLILGIDYADQRPDLAIEYAGAAGWTVPQLADLDKAVAAPLKVAGPPQTIFVRADGTIAYYHSGPFASAQQLRDLITQHLQVTL